MIHAVFPDIILAPLNPAPLVQGLTFPEINVFNVETDVSVLLYDGVG